MPDAERECEDAERYAKCKEGTEAFDDQWRIVNPTRRQAKSGAEITSGGGYGGKRMAMAKSPKPVTAKKSSQN